MLYLTLRQIEYVVAVARAGSLSGAAVALNVSQPSLSVALSQVEDRLGQTLFIRKKGTPLRMTTLAHRYVEEAERLLSMAHRMQDPVLLQRSINGTIALGCFEDLAPRYLAPLLRLLRQSLPGVEINWRIVDFQTLAGDMRDGRIDLSLTYDLGLDAGFEKIDLAQVAPYAFFNADHPLSHRHQVTLEDIASEPLVLFDEVLSNRHILQLFHNAGLSPIVAHRVGSLEIMRSLAANGEGVGISYTRPSGNLSYDGAQVRAVVIADRAAREPIILARTVGAPMLPVVTAAIFAIQSMFSGPEPDPAS